MPLVKSEEIGYMAYLSKDLGETIENGFFMQLIPIELQSFDEFFD